MLTYPISNSRGAIIDRDWIRQNIEEVCHDLFNRPLAPHPGMDRWWECRNTLFGIRYDFEVINLSHSYNTISYDWCIGIMEYAIPIHCKHGGDFNYYNEGFRIM